MHQHPHRRITFSAFSALSTRRFHSFGVKSTVVSHNREREIIYRIAHENITFAWWRDKKGTLPEILAPCYRYPHSFDKESIIPSCNIYFVTILNTITTKQSSQLWNKSAWRCDVTILNWKHDYHQQPLCMNIWIIINILKGFYWQLYLRNSQRLLFDACTIWPQSTKLKSASYNMKYAYLAWAPS